MNAIKDYFVDFGTIVPCIGADTSNIANLSADYSLQCCRRWLDRMRDCFTPQPERQENRSRPAGSWISCVRKASAISIMPTIPKLPEYGEPHDINSGNAFRSGYILQSGGWLRADAAKHCSYKWLQQWFRMSGALSIS